MTGLDNEFYRGVPDSEPTLREESVTDEFVKISDVPATPPESETSAVVEDRPAADTQKGKSGGLRKIIKMLKLTAAAVVTFAIATNAISVSGKAPNFSRFNMPQWPSWTGGYMEDGDPVVYVNSMGKESNVVQFVIDSRVFRFEDSTGAMCFIWEGTYGDTATIMVHSLIEDGSFTMHFSLSPFDKKDEANAYGTISSTTGDLFYIETVSHVYAKTDELVHTAPELEKLMYQVVVRSYVSEGTEDGWGKVFICDTLYSDVNQHWFGRGNLYDGIEWDFVMDDYEYLDLSNEIGRITVNDVPWIIYYQEDYRRSVTNNYNTQMIIAKADVPDENVLLIMERYGLNEIYYAKATPEEMEKMGEITDEVVVQLLKNYLQYFHKSPPEWTH
ncbi:MAG: hypothetical protein IJN63_10710 [Clostridia bacterium]|nr:hypothetical protein [Clostridia bacterium]